MLDKSSMIFESLPTSTKHHHGEFHVWQGLLTSRVKPIKDFINHMVEVTPRKILQNSKSRIGGWVIFVQVPGRSFSRGAIPYLTTEKLPDPETIPTLWPNLHPFHSLSLSQLITFLSCSGTLRVARDSHANWSFSVQLMEFQCK